jgi:hypothetical protein
MPKLNSIMQNFAHVMPMKMMTHMKENRCIGHDNTILISARQISSNEVFNLVAELQIKAAI